ncbi:MAG: diaminohydroxyphosphoribosylaminopyrimidine deaminase [Glaciecola sp.]|jgi:diaminohydroxyphosphoribosylaminopyrimidine deaminase/5-amino-6-(5-phosphoribosylamino)uracil reductase
MPKFTKLDAQWMSLALKLASKGRFSTTPNPNVGCVIVDAKNNIIGKGYHQKSGQAHAEVNALVDAGFVPHQNTDIKTANSQSKPITEGATAYVTLEPCSHVGKTPPCALALIEARISRVVIASVDKNPEVKHKGIQLLLDAGIKVDVGLMEAEADKLNIAFNHRMTKNSPFVTVKLATSLDGRTALANGKSKWITGTKARANVQVERALSCAILSGADTVLADNPKLNVRCDELPEFENTLFKQRGTQPIRIIIDGQNRLDNSYQIFQDEHPVIVFNAEHNKNLSTLNVEQIQVGLVDSNNIRTSEARKYLDLQAIMHVLAKKQINRVWTETGSALSGALMNANLVNELIIYQAPMLLGSDARGAADIGVLNNLDEAIKPDLQEVIQVGNDLKLRLSITS